MALQSRIVVVDDDPEVLEVIKKRWKTSSEQMAKTASPPMILSQISIRISRRAESFSSPFSHSMAPSPKDARYTPMVML